MQEKGLSFYCGQRGLTIGVGHDLSHCLMHYIYRSMHYAASFTLQTSKFKVHPIKLAYLFKFRCLYASFQLQCSEHLHMAQKVVVKILTMNDEKTKQKAIEAVADIYGVDSIEADLKEQKLTVIGEMDTIAIAKKLKKIGKIEIVTVGPAKEEKQEEKKDENKDDKE